MVNHTVFITGAAGYIGLALVEKFSARPDVELILALDKEPKPREFDNLPKVVYVRKNTSDDWEGEVAKYLPDIVIHAAWQIRDLYGNRALQETWNLDGSDKVFDFAFSQHGVTRLVHFSSVASYGAYPDNTIEHRFAEDEPFRPSDYNYAEEKRLAEASLKEKYESARARGKEIAVAIIRPAAITGPRGRFARMRFGLQSALSGQLRGSFVYRLVSMMTSFVPATPRWARQFIHEDDIVDITELLAFSDTFNGYEAYNACPPGEPVRAGDMAKAVGKWVVPMPPVLVRIAFFWMWHLTRGKIPTSRGAWKGYSYPIIVDGSKISRMHGYQYRMSGSDAFVYTDGRYESVVPPSLVKKRRV
jgi:nucleoside-diphosphate-sugar epimerase